MTTKKPEKLADQRYRDAKGKTHKRWTARKRWASTAPGGFAMFDEEKQKFSMRKASEWAGMWGAEYWKIGTKEQVESYIRRTRVETFMLQRAEAALDRGDVA
ncbi:MAG: hypothetical protein WCD47_21965 [Candidatus Sulfotelmatobacter sp.]